MKLGDRIKTFYENRTKTFLPRRMITIIRLDGKSFSKWTKNLEKPFDDGFSYDMDATAVYLCENIQGAKFAYTQSDEITVVLTDFDTLDSQAWFDYNVQKMVSIAASLATAKFNNLRTLRDMMNGDCESSDLETFISTNIDRMKLACFDARVFQVPNLDEMVNAIIWRQQDCTRNSVSMAAHALLGHSATMNKSSDEKQEMLFQEKGVNWNDYLPKYKRGTIIKKQTIFVDGQNNEPVQRTKWLPDYNTPVFTQDREYLMSLIPKSEII